MGASQMGNETAPDHAPNGPNRYRRLMVVFLWLQINKAWLLIS